MYKKIINAILVIVCLTAIVSLGGCMSEEQRHQNTIFWITSMTGIEVPIDSKILFSYVQDTGFAPDRQEVLKVFEFESEPTDWLKENKFLRSDDETKTEDGETTLAVRKKLHFLRNFDIEKIDKKGIPKEYVPNFDIPYFFADTGIYNFCFFYYPDILRLIVYLPGS